MLHITNGQSAANTIRAAGLPGEVVSWDDVLHEGPVPAGLSLAEMSEVRARFIADSGWGDYDAVLAGFRARDEALARFREQDEVVLWFEHDLYDQLQLIQILDWLAGQERGGTTLSLICVGAFPGVEPFLGLGQLDAAQMASLFPGRQAVTDAQLALGRDAWRAFTSPDPTAIEALLAAGTDALPFLAGALIRHLEQFPSVANGLGRTERQILAAVAAGARMPVKVFVADQEREEHPFMGDSTLWQYVYRLVQGSRAALALKDGGAFRYPDEFADHRRFWRQELVLTETGRALLAGTADWVVLNGIDRWLGGVHLQGAEAAWRWDEGTRKLVAA